MSLLGLNGYLISVEVDVSAGIPCFEIVGLPDTSIKESKERVQTAIRNSGIPLLSKKIIVNLAPANIRKEGSMFDLPMAVGVLIATENIKNKKIQELLNNTVFVGELSLDGKLNKISGILPICIEAKKLGINQIILPKENAKEASIISGLKILPVESLQDVIKFLNNQLEINPEEKDAKNSNYEDNYGIDFSDVKGQENVKRAMEISAARRTQLSFNWFTWKWKNNDIKALAHYFARYDF